MAPPRTGYYFRRARGKQFNIDDRTERSATIYFSFRIGRRHKAICCHTANLAVAEQRIAWFGDALKLDSYERFLSEIARLGRRAEAEMDASLEARARKGKTAARK